MSQIARGVLSFTLELTDCPRADVTAYAGLPLVLEQARIALRPKALRFRFFNVAGRLLYGARQLVLRLSAALPSAQLYAKARQILRAALPRPAPA
jgi:hypothetical protein